MTPQFILTHILSNRGLPRWELCLRLRNVSHTRVSSKLHRILPRCPAPLTGWRKASQRRCYRIRDGHEGTLLPMHYLSACKIIPQLLSLRCWSIVLYQLSHGDHIRWMIIRRMSLIRPYQPIILISPFHLLICSSNSL